MLIDFFDTGNGIIADYVKPFNDFVTTWGNKLLGLFLSAETIAEYHLGTVLNILVMLVLILLYPKIAGLVQQMASKFQEKKPYRRFVRIPYGSKKEDGIVQLLKEAKKATPEFVHYMPEREENAMVIQRLEQQNFHELVGNSGNGKSVSAYQVCYHYSRKNYKTYQYKTRSAVGDKEDSLIEEEIDALCKSDKYVMLLVDDAHLLQSRKESVKELLLEKCGANPRMKVLWVETTFHGELDTSESGTAVTRLEFGSFRKVLVQHYREHYNKKFTHVQFAIRQLEENKVLDPWQFNFIATQANEVFEQRIRTLTDLELLTVYLVSSYSVMTGDKAISTADLVGRLERLAKTPGFEFIADNRRKHHSFDNLVAYLEKQGLIKINNRDIHSLHYNFSKFVIGIALDTALAPMLLSAYAEWIQDSPYAFKNVHAYLYVLDRHAEPFLRQCEDWMTAYVGQPEPDLLSAYPKVLDAIEVLCPAVYSNILRVLDADAVCRRLEAVDAARLQSAASYIRGFKRKAELLLANLNVRAVAERIQPIGSIAVFRQLSAFVDLLDGKKKQEFVDALRMEELVHLVNAMEPEHFGAVGALIKSLGPGGIRILQHPDLRLQAIASAANRVNLEQFTAFASFYHMLDPATQTVLYDGLEVGMFIAQANQATPDQFDHVTSVHKGVFAKGSQAFVSRLDWDRIAATIPQIQQRNLQRFANLLEALGPYRNSLLSRIDKYISHLAGVISSVESGYFYQAGITLGILSPSMRIRLLQDAQFDYGAIARSAGAMQTDELQQFSTLLSALGDEKHRLLEHREFPMERLATVASHANRDKFQQLSNLLAALAPYDAPLLTSPGFDFGGIADSASRVTPDKFQQLANLLDALGSHRGLLIRHPSMRLDQVKTTIGTVTVARLQQLAELLKSFDTYLPMLMDEAWFEAILTLLPETNEKDGHKLCVLMRVLPEAYRARMLDRISLTEKIELNDFHSNNLYVLSSWFAFLDVHVRTNRISEEERNRIRPVAAAVRPKLSQLVVRCPHQQYGYLAHILVVIDRLGLGGEMAVIDDAVLRTFAGRLHRVALWTPFTQLVYAFSRLNRAGTILMLNKDKVLAILTRSFQAATAVQEERIEFLSLVKSLSLPAYRQIIGGTVYQGVPIPDAPTLAWPNLIEPESEGVGV